MPPKAAPPKTKVKAMKGGAYDPMVMNTRGLMDPSHNIYNVNGDNGLLSIHSPFSAGMATFSSGSSGIDSESWKYFVPSLGAAPLAGGGKPKAKAKAKPKAKPSVRKAPSKKQ